MNLQVLELLAWSLDLPPVPSHSSGMKRSLICGILLQAAVLLTAVLAERNATQLVEELKGSRADAIAADSIAGQIDPLFSGYASLNQEVRPLVLSVHPPASRSPPGTEVA